MNNNIKLREVQSDDLEIFFQQLQDKEAQNMAAFIHKDPSDRAAFDAHWNKIMNDTEVMIRTIILDTKVIGHMAKFVMFGDSELTYWIGKDYWGKGYATKALEQFLLIFTPRPLFSRAAKDNIGSLKVLEKCNFIFCQQPFCLLDQIIDILAFLIVVFEFADFYFVIRFRFKCVFDISI